MVQPACIKVTIQGRVQKVFFRAETKRAADRLNLTGYVKNLADGSVEAFFQGEKTKVLQMVEWCHKGPRASRVDKVLEEPALALTQCDTFEIRY